VALFKLAHLYPDLMNLYGDRGNLLCLKKRLEWRGHQCEIMPIARGGVAFLPGLRPAPDGRRL
jgi:Predicted glutamine amidotransferase